MFAWIYCPGLAGVRIKKRVHMLALIVWECMIDILVSRDQLLDEDTMINKTSDFRSL
uniref:Uncharacterized protein n=1 Tax=Arion vulgaris TaxID=1028688 RepID=A0A0B7AWK3_9EUPU